MNPLPFPPMIIPLALAVFAAGCPEQAPKKLPPSSVKADEDILFYPTYGSYDEQTNSWRFDVHGKVFEPEESSIKRAALIAVLQASADVSFERDAFRDDRIRPFLVDNERGKSVTVEIAEGSFLAGTSQANGHFSKTLTLDAESFAPTKEKNSMLEMKAVLRSGDSRAFTGRVHLIAPQGVSVISDIDDTIKHSQVTSKSELLKNTFLREFTAVEGMPELYADLAKLDVAFHYVSGSPWQLYQPLETFMTDVGFPKGTFVLKQFRLKDSSALEILSSQKETKFAAITPLLNGFPDRDFILIGDSGEQDPEIYGEVARQHPDQVVGIFIRNVTGEKSDEERFLSEFQGVPDNRWTLFDDVSQIAEQIIEQARTKP